MPRSGETMTPGVSQTDHGEEIATRPGSWVLPALASSLLTLLWGAYTVFVVMEVATSPIPPGP
jgi:hypothetical protein